MKNGQHGSIARRVQKFVDVPGSRQWAGLRLAVANYRGHDQLWVVECCATSVGEHIAEFAAFVDRSRSFRSAMTADAPWKGKLPKEFAQSVRILTLLWIHLGVCAFEIART